MTPNVMRALNLVLNMSKTELAEFATHADAFDPMKAERLEFLLGVAAMERTARDAALREKVEESALL